MKNKKYNLLVVTDHEGHKDWESIYFVLPRLLNCSRCQQVCIASASDDRNADFFNGSCVEEIFARPLDDEYSFENRREWHARSKKIKTTHFDVFHLKIDPPVSHVFLTSIETTFADKCLINRPKGIIKWGDKANLIHLGGLCPPSTSVNSFDDVLRLARQYSVVVKPTHSYGGAGVCLLKNQEGQVFSFIEDLETSLDEFSEYFGQQVALGQHMIAMKFLSGVQYGDKRVLMAGSNVIGGMNRVPATGSWLANTSKGARTYADSVLPDEEAIAKEVAELVRLDGVFSFGVDLIRDEKGQPLVSEINVTNVGGLRRIEIDTGIPVATHYAEYFWDYVDNYFSNIKQGMA